MYYFVLVLPMVVGNIILPQLPTPYLTLSANNVTEGQPITFKCSIYSLDSVQVTWYWQCGNNNLTGSATNTLHDSILTLQSDRVYDGVVCFCKVRPTGTNDTYSKMSNHMTISVKYVPRTIPFLNASSTVAVEGDEITLQCTLDTLGNPPIMWTWKCGRYVVYDRRVVNVNATTKLIMPADKDLDAKVCHCVARSYPLHYEAASNSVSLTVYYSPDGSPQIDKTVVYVDENTPVMMTCFLSTRGNPPVTWTWYCDNKEQLKGVKNTGSSSVLTIIAQSQDHNIACHCSAKSDSQWGSYDKNSSKAIINIKSFFQSSANNPGVSSDVFGAVTGILVIVIITAGVAIFYHHRKIVDIGNRLVTKQSRGTDLNACVGQDNINYSSLQEERAHPTDQ